MTQAERKNIGFSEVEEASQQSPYLTSALIVDDDLPRLKGIGAIKWMPCQIELIRKLGDGSIVRIIQGQITSFHA